MAQGEAVLGKLSLQVWSGGTALDACGARYLIHLDHLAQSREVDRDRSVVAGVHDRLHPADHARPTPVGDRGDALGCAPLQELLDVALVTRRSDEVRRMLEMAAEAEHDVRIGLTECMGSTRVRIGGTDTGELRWCHHSRSRQTHSVQAHRILDLPGREAEVRGQTTGGGTNLLGRRLLVLEAPTPVLASTGAHRRELRGRGPPKP